MELFTIKPLEWTETKDGLFACEVGDVRYTVHDNEKFPPTSHDGRPYAVTPSKGFIASGDWMESDLYDTPEQAKAACEAAWRERILPALEPANR